MKFTPPDGTGVLLGATVFPSTTRTITSIVTDEQFSGAHDYVLRAMVDYDKDAGEAVYAEQGSLDVYLPFVKKMPDGSMRPGLQTEQLLQVILDRHPKLNAQFSSDEHAMFMSHIEAALALLGARFRGRMERKVDGEHKA